MLGGVESSIVLRVGAIREVCRRELSAGPCRWNREDEGVKLRLRHSPERTRLVLVTVPRQKVFVPSTHQIWYLRNIRYNVLWLTGRPALNTSSLYVILGFTRIILKILRLSRFQHFGGRPVQGVDSPCGR